MKKILQYHTILYAEDDKAVQEVTREYLQRYFKEVYVANDGREALVLYQKKYPDVVMLDIDMPYVNGLSVAKEIRAENKEIPILMFTAFTEVDKLLKATELNLCKYLVKPVTPIAVKEALRNLGQKLQENEANYISLKEGFKWDSSQEILLHKQRKILLSQKEKRLLLLLLKKHHKCVSFEEIMAVVWEDDFETEISMQSVKFQVTLLRKKLPNESIKNVYGKGYILD